MPKILPVDPVEDKCIFCPLGIIRTSDLGSGHLHDACDGCSWRLCLPSLGQVRCWVT
jgi:hypothetical protein